MLGISGSSSLEVGIIFSLYFDFILHIIMFLFITLLVYSSSTFDMVMIDDEFMYMFAKRLALFAGGLGDRCHVSMVLRCCLSTITPYLLGCMVDHGSDNSVESFVFHPPLVGQVEHSCVGSLALSWLFITMFLIHK